VLVLRESGFFVGSKFLWSVLSWVESWEFLDADISSFSVLLTTELLLGDSGVVFVFLLTDFLLVGLFPLLNEP